MNTFSISEALRFGWEKTRDNYSKIFSVLLALLFVTLSMSFLKQALHRSDMAANSLVYAFTMLGFLVIELILIINVIEQGLLIVRGGEGSISKLLEYPRVFFFYILGALSAGIIIIVGFVLLIIPGIFAALILCFVKPILVDLKLGPIDALAKSRELTKGHLWDLFLFFLVILLINLAGAIIFGIGLLVTLPISFFAILSVYDKLLRESGSSQASNEGNMA